MEINEKWKNYITKNRTKWLFEMDARAVKLFVNSDIVEFFQYMDYAELDEYENDFITDIIEVDYGFGEEIIKIKIEKFTHQKWNFMLKKDFIYEGELLRITEHFFYNEYIK